MTKASDNAFPSILITEGTEPSAPAAGKQRLYIDSTSHLLKATNSSGTDRTLEASLANYVIFASHLIITASTGSNAAPTASAAFAHPVQIPGTMLLRTCTFNMQAAASGTYQWGLFSPAGTPTTAVKLAGGSGALNSTGWVSIAATGAPVTVAAGNYIFIMHVPAANVGNMYRSGNASMGIVKAQTSYTWDDTPDLTTGWSSSTQEGWSFYLRGDLDGSNQWPG